MFRHIARRPRMYEDVVAQIEAAILSGQQAPGDQLPSERELIERFAVSRAVIREALKVLSEKGLIETRAGKGAFIKSPESSLVSNALKLYLQRKSDEKFRHDLIQVRKLLECEIARLAAAQATAEDIEKLAAALARMEQEVEDVGRFAQADLQFHQALAEATHNELMALLLQPVTGLLLNMMADLSPLPHARQEAIAHHRRILKAVKAGDEERARISMCEHLTQFEKRFKQYQAKIQVKTKPSEAND